MAKVSKKQLGRRRRTALLLLLALIAAAVYLLFFRSDSSRNAPTEETTAVLQSTAMTETTTTEEIGVLYQGTIPVQTELTVPTEPAVLTASQVELDAQPILQNPELPTGCEVTALTAALNYLGVVLVLLVIIGVGVASGRRVKSAADFATGGGRSGPRHSGTWCWQAR